MRLQPPARAFARARIQAELEKAEDKLHCASHSLALARVRLSDLQTMCEIHGLFTDGKRMNLSE